MAVWRFGPQFSNLDSSTCDSLGGCTQEGYTLEGYTLRSYTLTATLWESESRSADFKSRWPNTCATLRGYALRSYTMGGCTLGDCTLGAESFGPPILDLISQPPVLGRATL